MLSIHTKRIFSRVAPSVTRAASTQAQGLASILRKNPNDVVITFAKRTAIGKVNTGQLKDTPPDELLHALFKATLQETKLDPSKIDDICVGTCYPPSPVYASRTAALAAGIPQETTLSQVNRLCSSGLMAVRHIAHAIKSGEISLGVAVGVEVMSCHTKPTPIITEVVSRNAQAQDCVQPMGWTSEMVAQQYKVPRQKQDEYALISHTRASQALADGIFQDEIIPIEVRGKKITEDDVIRTGVTGEMLAALKPSFPEWGDATTTAGNAGAGGDGAAICVLTTRERAEKEGMDIIGKYVSCAVAGLEPRYMGNGPIPAISKILAQTGLTKENIDLWEINEAFGSQFAYCVEELQIPMEKINPNGGAIAITHPVGMTGLRQVVTGLAEMQRSGANVLCTTMCVGAGMGAAGIFVNEARHNLRMEESKIPWC